jgi:predicted RNA-binding protein with EMAP domain
MHRGNFVPKEVEELIKDIQEVFNKISNDFDLSATTFEFIKNDSINNVHFLFENLERGEAQRQGEIIKKYGNI